MRSVALMNLAFFVSLAGCEDPVVVGPAPSPAFGSPQTATTVAGGPAAGATGGDAGIRFADDDFVEVDLRHRDPFRSYSAQVDPSAQTVAVSRYVKMSDIAIDEMRLIAIVTGATRPYAMVVDRQNMGHVIEVRDYIGRAEVVQTGGAESMPIQLNWRVDRIREGEVVLAREDPTAPNQPPVLRTLQLHPEGEMASSRGIVTGPSRATDPSSGTAGPSPTVVPSSPGFRLTVTPPEAPPPQRR
jgi:type IV pilus assembly protein PilP